MRILVTGARGMLGTDLCEILGREHEIIGVDIEDFKVADRCATQEAVRRVKPEVICHLAAFTRVDDCETERELAFRTNALGTMNVAAAARQAGSMLVYVSTDYVFDGEKGAPYVETDPPRPLSFYGLTKHFGERYVSGLTLRYLIVRTSWLFGPNGPNFVDTMVKKAAEGTSLRVVDDQTGCPTYTLDLAKGIKFGIEEGLEGVVHVTNLGETTWFGLASEAIAQAGIQADISPCGTDDYPVKAARPRYSVLDNLVIRMSGMEPLRPWKQAVKHHLERKGLGGGG
jgi:dTDP-4-dehydrorhamnose reductase